MKTIDEAVPPEQLFLEKLKKRSNLLGGGIYILSDEDRYWINTLFPAKEDAPSTGFNAFTCVKGADGKERVIFNYLFNEQNNAIITKYYFSNLIEQYKLGEFTFSKLAEKIPEGSKALDKLYFFGDSTTPQPEVMALDKNSPPSDEELLKGKPAGSFILRNSTTLAGAKALAFVVNEMDDSGNPILGNNGIPKTKIIQRCFIVKDGGINEHMAMSFPEKNTNNPNEIVKKTQAVSSEISELARSYAEHQQKIKKITRTFKEVSSKPNSTEEALPMPTIEEKKPARIIVSDFTSLPGKVDIGDIESNGKLLTDEEISFAKAEINRQQVDRLPVLKKTKADPTDKKHYTVIRMTDPITKADKYYAIYKGQKHSKSLGAGAFGSVKLMQDLDTGEWCAIKIINHHKIYKKMADEIAKFFAERKLVLAPPTVINKIIKVILERPLYILSSDLNQGTYDALIELSNDNQLNLKTEDVYEILKSVYSLVPQAVKDFQMAKSESENNSALKQDKGRIFRAEVKQTTLDKHQKSEYRVQSILGMELASGVNLLKLSERKMPASRWLKIIGNILSAAKGIHDQNMLHRDIKTDNIICDPVTGKITFVDLGFAISKSDAKNKSAAGTPFFMAPEIKKAYLQQLLADNDYQGVNYGEKTEIYALGMTIAEMLKLTREIKDEMGFLALEIVKDQNDKFANTNINNPALREVITNYLLKMTASNPEERPTLEEAIEFFNEIQSQLIDILGQFKSVGILNVQDYMSNDKRGKAAMKEALKNYDEVWLVDPQYQAETKYYLLQKELEDAGINVAAKVLHGLPGQNLSAGQIASKIPEYFAEKQEHSMDRYFYVASKKGANLLGKESETSKKFSQQKISIIIVKADVKAKKYKQEIFEHYGKYNVSSQHLLLVIKLLKNEQSRLEQKHQCANDSILLERIGKIEELLNKLNSNDNKNMTYDQLEESLTALEESMKSLNVLTRKLAEWLPINVTTSAKKIKEIKEVLFEHKVKYINAEENKSEGSDETKPGGSLMRKN